MRRLMLALCAVTVVVMEGVDIAAHNVAWTIADSTLLYVGAWCLLDE